MNDKPISFPEFCTMCWRIWKLIGAARWLTGTHSGDGKGGFQVYNTWNPAALAGIVDHPRQLIFMIAEGKRAQVLYDLVRFKGLEESPDAQRAFTEKVVQQMAESAHEAWMNAYRQMGYVSRIASWGEEFMVPFNRLSDRGKEFDRVIMRSILRAFDKMGLEVTEKR